VNVRRALAGEEGTILPLVLGYVVVALAAVFVCVCATSLYLDQKRLDGLADAAALAAADGFTLVVEGDEPRAELTSAGVHEQAEALLSVAALDAALVSAETPDGVSARVTVAGVWHPPLVSLFVPDGVPLEATATSRTALR
jgi:uncharacterized membrane protein